MFVCCIDSCCLLSLVLPYPDCVWPGLKQPKELMEEGGVQVEACQGLGRESEGVTTLCTYLPNIHSLLHLE